VRVAPWVLAFALSGCSDPGPFEFYVWANDYTGADETFQIQVDGVPVRSRSGIINLANRQFPDYQTGLSEGLVVIETRMGDTVLDRCELRPGACHSECVPDRESSSVCIDPTGAIGLNTYDCPCDDGVADWFCGGECSETGPSP